MIVSLEKVLVFDVVNSKFFVILPQRGVINVAMVVFNNLYFNARVWCLCVPPVNVIAQKCPLLWSEFIKQRNYNRLICVKHANIMPFTTAGIICTFLPFFHAAVLCLSDDWLESILLIKHTSTLNWLMRDYPPDRGKFVEVIDICRQPQVEPRRFDSMLNMIYPFENFRIDSKPAWESARLQAEARDFQHRIKELSGSDENFSGPITYVLNAHEIRLEVPYEAYMIYQNNHVITLVQNDKVAGT